MCFMYTIKCSMQYIDITHLKYNMVYLVCSPTWDKYNATPPLIQYSLRQTSGRIVKNAEVVMLPPLKLYAGTCMHHLANIWYYVIL